ncbi:MAG: NAD(P)-dependent oxidoreductase [Hyphomicrobium sp.]|nr:NAD(P)-dependent oxidoreductase [Hyphomicrobium sp.]
MTRFRDLKVFVTGGTGFIGSRLVEVLRNQLNADVTVLAHRTSPGALRLAADGVKLDFTPIGDADGLKRALAGVDAVFHLAYGKFGSDADMKKTTIDGTTAIVDAALAANVTSFVNVSTAAVYFGAPSGVIDETAPRRKWGWTYSDDKLAAEDVVRKAHGQRGLRASIFQVAGVYGPWGETFVINPLTIMRRGFAVLPNHGLGVANMTYVDDVVQALILGLKDEAVGETFIIKGPGRITRLEAYRQLEAMLGYPAVETASTKDIKSRLGGGNWSAMARIVPAAVAALQESKAVKDAVRASPIAGLARPLYRSLRRRGRSGIVKGSGKAFDRATPLPRILPPPIMVDYLSAEVEFTSAKAERVLGYTPQIDLETGMGFTREWAEWANLLGPRRT